MATLKLTSGQLNVTAEAGTTWRLALTCRDESGELLDLTGFACVWSLWRSKGAPPLLTATTEDHLTLMPGKVPAQIALVIPASVSKIPAQGYAHRFTLTEPSGATPPFIAGSWKVVSS